MPYPRSSDWVTDSPRLVEENGSLYRSEYVVLVIASASINVPVGKNFLKDGKKSVGKFSATLPGQSASPSRSRKNVTSVVNSVSDVYLTTKPQPWKE